MSREPAAFCPINTRKIIQEGHFETACGSVISRGVQEREFQLVCVDQAHYTYESLERSYKRRVHTFPRLCPGNHPTGVLNPNFPPEWSIMCITCHITVRPHLFTLQRPTCWLGSTVHDVTVEDPIWQQVQLHLTSGLASSGANQANSDRALTAADEKRSNKTVSITRGDIFRCNKLAQNEIGLIDNWCKHNMEHIVASFIIVLSLSANRWPVSTYNSWIHLAVLSPVLAGGVGIIFLARVGPKSKVGAEEGAHIYIWQSESHWYLVTQRGLRTTVIFILKSKLLNADKNNLLKSRCNLVYFSIKYTQCLLSVSSWR